MHKFSPNNLFDLSQFSHQKIFENCDMVWQVLSKIALFLSHSKLGKIKGDVEKGAYLINPETITIGKGTIVESGAYIQGPCIIGEDCEIRFGAYIRGNVITGKKCVIGHTTEVKNALFLNDVKASHFAYIGDTVLGNKVNLGAGVKCANLRLDEKNIFVNFEGKKIDTHLRKFGAILGDEAHVGCNSVLNPGTILGKKSSIYPCLSVKGVIEENTVIKEMAYVF